MGCLAVSAACSRWAWAKDAEHTEREDARTMFYFGRRGAENATQQQLFLAIGADSLQCVGNAEEVIEVAFSSNCVRLCGA